jgi:TolA-binding protein
VAGSAGNARAAFESLVKDYPDQWDWAAEGKMQLVGLKLEDAMNGRATFAQAQADADAFIAEYPKMTRVPNLRIMRAESLFYQHKLDEAIAEIAIIQEQYPNCGKPAITSQFLLAQCYDGKRDYDRAAAEYQKFLDTKGLAYNDWEARPAALYGIAMCLRAAGRPEAAATAFAKLRHDYPKSYFIRIVDAHQEPRQ